MADGTAQVGLQERWWPPGQPAPKARRCRRPMPSTVSCLRQSLRESGPLYAADCCLPNLGQNHAAVRLLVPATLQAPLCRCGKHRPAAAAAADVIGRPRCWFDAVEEACGRSILPSALRNARYKALRPRCAPRTSVSRSWRSRTPAAAAAPLPATAQPPPPAGTDAACPPACLPALCSPACPAVNSTYHLKCAPPQSCGRCRGSWRTRSSGATG